MKKSFLFYSFKGKVMFRSAAYLAWVRWSRRSCCRIHILFALIATLIYVSIHESIKVSSIRSRSYYKKKFFFNDRLGRNEFRFRTSFTKIINSGLPNPLLNKLQHVKRHARTPNIIMIVV